MITGLALNIVSVFVAPSPSLTEEALSCGITPILSNYLSIYSGDGNIRASAQENQPVVEYLLGTLSVIDSMLPALPPSSLPILLLSSHYHIIILIIIILI